LYSGGHGHAHTLDTGGSLGWKSKGSLDPQFEEVAFKIPPSPVASPTFERVKTGFGYHIIMVEERK
jgi:NIMA-interacting peptidyl-prolyl cis-trans isomerase 4